MQLLASLCRLLLRFRYPVSMPEDVARDLGCTTSYFFTLEDLLSELLLPQFRSPNLKKFMPRSRAEEVFKMAYRKEKFRDDTLFSYYFKEGWIEFVLQFDAQGRLRRMYLLHKDLKQKVEISLG